MLHNDEKPQEKTFDIALQRWFHAITGHILFNILLGAFSIASIGLIMGCVWFFAETGGVIFLAVAVPLAAVAGGIWATIHGINRQLQFDHVTYLLKDLWKHIRQTFTQGAWFGIVLMLFCTVLYLPVLMSQMMQEEIPLGFVCLSLTGTVLLPIVAEYTFYQISHWKIGTFAAIRNSMVLIFHLRWRSIAVCIIWAAYYVLLVIYPLVMIPLSMLCGLMPVLNMTTQALVAPKIDAQMEAHSITY